MYYYYYSDHKMVDAEASRLLMHFNPTNDSTQDPTRLFPWFNPTWVHSWVLLLVQSTKRAGPMGRRSLQRGDSDDGLAHVKAALLFSPQPVT